MATAEFRGYVNRPESKESSRGGFSKFSLGVQQKNKGRNGQPDTVTKYYVDCINFKDSTPPQESSFVTVSGYLDINEYESKTGRNAGKTMQGLRLNVQSLDIAPPRDGTATAPPQAPAGNPFDDSAPF